MERQQQDRTAVVVVLSPPANTPFCPHVRPFACSRGPVVAILWSLPSRRIDAPEIPVFVAKAISFVVEQEETVFQLAPCTSSYFSRLALFFSPHDGGARQCQAWLEEHKQRPLLCRTIIVGLEGNASWERH